MLVRCVTYGLLHNWGVAQRDETIRAYLGSPRLAPYMSACQDDVGLAVELYEWNLQLAAAVQEIMMLLEVAVRNAIDEQLKPWNVAPSRNSHNPGLDFTEEWIAGPAIPLHGLMVNHTKNAITYAQAAKGKRPPGHPRKQAPISHDDLLSQLSFRTWPSILPHPVWPQTSISVCLRNVRNSSRRSAPVTVSQRSRTSVRCRPRLTRRMPNPSDCSP
jgi:hypothetical protein